MRRFFNILLGALAMIAVALLSAFLTMRLAIHGREVEIPNVAGLTVAEAGGEARKLGLNMDVENQFYSTVTPSGRILSQSPAPGIKVRREWVLRVTESIGPQKVSVPDVIGKTEREASVTIRRLSLNLGTVAYIAAPGPAGIVLSQTPTPDAGGVDGPRISLLVSEPVPVLRQRQAVHDAAPDDAAQPQADGAEQTQAAATATPIDRPAGQTASEQSAATSIPSDGAPIVRVTPPPSETAAEAYVMPNLVGLSLSAAGARVAAMGLHISSMDAVSSPIRQIAPVAAPLTGGVTANGQPALRPIAPVAPITLSNTVVAQRPAAGHRVTRNDAIHITLSR